jgi:hypothetical protein
VTETARFTIGAIVASFTAIPAVARGDEASSDQTKARVHLFSAVLQGGPAMWVTDAPCGSYARCPKISAAIAGTLLVRPIEPLSFGLSVVHHPYGTVTPQYPLVALYTRSLHLDVVARFHFGTTGRFYPWAQLGAGPATVYTTCTEGGQMPCGADPALPTEDSVGGISVRPSGGVDFGVTDWFFANAAIEALTITNGQGHVCGRGACATSPGTRIAPTLFFGISVSAF